MCLDFYFICGMAYCFSQTHPLMSHSGFEHVFCYGDVLLSFVWNHDEDILELKRKSPTGGTSELVVKSVSVPSSMKHDFVRTQFHRTTHCDYCTKKVSCFIKEETPFYYQYYSNYTFYFVKFITCIFHFLNVT